MERVADLGQVVLRTEAIHCRQSRSVVGQMFHGQDEGLKRCRIGRVTKCVEVSRDRILVSRHRAGQDFSQRALVPAQDELCSKSRKLEVIQACIGCARRARQAA